MIFALLGGKIEMDSVPEMSAKIDWSLTFLGAAPKSPEPWGSPSTSQKDDLPDE